MIRKRLVGVVTVKDGWAVQSFGYGRYLPLGKPEVLVENLDRWGADEILLQCIDRWPLAAGPDLRLLDRVGKRGLSTPLIYAGGIRSAQDAVDVVQAAADRVAVDALLHDDLDQVARAGARLGNQAIIGALPLSRDAEGGLSWLDHRSRTERPLSAPLMQALTGGLISEALVIDWRHEGAANAFDETLLDLLPGDFSLIAFGGISTPDQVESVLRRPRVVACGVGNFLSYREHAVQALKARTTALPLRPAHYQRDTHA
jgi:imidazole glycerol-phosphate synthase subunit HisF